MRFRLACAVVACLSVNSLALAVAAPSGSQPSQPQRAFFHPHGHDHSSSESVFGSTPPPIATLQNEKARGRTVVHGPGGRELPARRFPGKLPEFIQRDIDGKTGGEPTVTFNQDGTAYYAAIGPGIETSVPRTFVMKSSDDGDNWTDVTPLDPTSEAMYLTGDPFIHADPATGRVFSVDLSMTENCNNLAFSDDQGGSWNRSKICPASDHQSLFTGPATVEKTKDYANLVYLYTNSCGERSCFLRSRDGGVTWDKPSFVFKTCGPQAGHGHASWADGTIYIPRTTCDVPYTPEEKKIDQAEVAISRDNGTTWDIVVVDDEMGVDSFHWGSFGSDDYGSRDSHEARITTDSEGNAYYVFTDAAGMPRLSVSRDQGRTWTRPMMVGVPGLEETNSMFIDVVAGSKGKVAMTYLGSDGWGVTDAGNIAAPTWNQYVAMTLNALADKPVFATTTTNPLEDPLKRGECEFRCAGTNKAFGMMDFFNIGINPKTGMVWTALVDLCTVTCDGEGRPGRGFVPELELNQAGVGVQTRGARLGYSLPRS